MLAFELAVREGNPGSIMAAYNKVNGQWSSEYADLLNGVIKGEWGFRGWIMSDWGAVHSTAAANAGLERAGPAV